MSLSVDPKKDAFLYDREELEKIAYLGNVTRGLVFFSENRVISIDSDGQRSRTIRQTSRSA